MQSSLDDVNTWAIVTAIEANGLMKLEVMSSSDDSACQTGGCGSGGLGCQTNVFARLLSPAPALTLRLPLALNIQKGDLVRLSLPQTALVKQSLLAYGLPLLALLLGMLFGQWLANDLGALSLGLISLLFTWFLVGKLTFACIPHVQEIKRSNLN